MSVELSEITHTAENSYNIIIHLLLRFFKQTKDFILFYALISILLISSSDNTSFSIRFSAKDCKLFILLFNILIVSK